MDIQKNLSASLIDDIFVKAERLILGVKNAAKIIFNKIKLTFFPSKEIRAPSPSPTSSSTTTSLSSDISTCLSDEETPTWRRDSAEDGKLLAKILILRKGTKDNVIKSFSIETGFLDAPYSYMGGIQPRRCAVYARRVFNYDIINNKLVPGSNELLPGGSMELWRYTYDGKGEKILTLYEREMTTGKYNLYFSEDFDINETETIAAIYKGGYVITGYGDNPFPYGVVFRNLKTGKDEFEITIQELVEKYRVPNGFISVRKSWWYHDDIFSLVVLEDHLVYGVEINTNNWEVINPVFHQWGP